MSTEGALKPDSGLHGLAGIAAYFRIPADPAHLARELALGERAAEADDIVRAARHVGLKARMLRDASAKRIAAIPMPALARTREGGYVVLGGLTPNGQCRTVDPVSRADLLRPVAEVAAALAPEIILVQRRVGGPGLDPESFSIAWFAPSIWRYRRALAHVVLASLVIQLFALVTPLFFQVVIDKVLVHRSASTLYVLVAGLILINVFDTALQFLRTYALNHTTNRIDVELGQRLFAHLLRLPVSYFETRPTGQTVARMRELETIRTFLTGQALSSALDFVFAIIFIAVLFLYSAKLASIVIATIPLYVLVAALVGPGLRERIKEKFNRGALSQQLLVETVVGAQTVKAAAVEPAMRAEWEEKLAASVRTGFSASLMAAGGQGAIQFVSKLSTALLLLFGADAVMSGELSVGALVAFNMIAGQVAQPVLRLSQLWQDFQQVRISVVRLGDILNAPPEPGSRAMAALPPPRGAIEFRRVSFRYAPGAPDVLKEISLAIRPGEVLGIVGPSGSGKSSLAKLLQRFYGPNEGQVLLDGTDFAQADTAWLRRHTGVVLQENLLFNRTLHENIAFANPAMPRAKVMHVARLAGADEFIARLPAGYDTPIEERGANLSGGQRQRIAIARALATDPRILIFDEATSALDYESERIIQGNMRHIAKGRTMIVIAHRLSTVRHADRIVGMQDGRIVEVGAHDELLARPGGLYARLWAMQFQGAGA
ncbi:type I secretion system permease/ATPase [Alsobacter sp. KACC 23698]|uniref:Type I secretion system permease/ATPase n=1 Tax=Alsobacter sp. KACC 23698 TaxID=3149229 RepID=A0AAU7JFQ6_9HYPH